MYITMTTEEHQGFITQHSTSSEGLYEVQFFGEHRRAVEVTDAPGIKAIGTVWICPREGKVYGPCNCEIV